MVLETSIKKSVPLFGTFELTRRCNLRCIHCYQTDYSGNELSLAEIKRILRQLKSAKSLFISFTGGEPLTRKDFFEIAKVAKLEGFALILQTNGTLIDVKIADELKSLKFVEIHLSLLGATEKTHDRITGVNGSYVKLMEGISLLKKREMNIILNITLMKENINELKRMRSLVSNPGLKYRFSPLISPRNDGSLLPLKHQIDDIQLKNVFYDFKNMISGKFTVKRDISELPICNFGRVTYSITPEGKVYPCVAAPISAGSLRRQPFSRIWNKSRLLDRIRNVTSGNLKACISCRYSNSCVRCPGISYLEKKDLWIPSIASCRIPKILEEVMN